MNNCDLDTPAKARPGAEKGKPRMRRGSPNLALHDRFAASCSAGVARSQPKEACASEWRRAPLARELSLRAPGAHGTIGCVGDLSENRNER